MDGEQFEGHAQTEGEDQYSLPTCHSQAASFDCSNLGPSTTQLLGVLQALESL